MLGEGIEGKQNPSKQIKNAIDDNPQLLDDKGMRFELHNPQARAYAVWENTTARQITTGRIPTGDLLNAVMTSPSILFDVDEGLTLGAECDTSELVAQNQDQPTVLAAFFSHVDINNPDRTRRKMRHELRAARPDEKLAIMDTVRRAVFLQENVSFPLT